MLKVDLQHGKCFRQKPGMTWRGEQGENQADTSSRKVQEIRQRRYSVCYGVAVATDAGIRLEGRPLDVTDRAGGMVNHCSVLGI